ncbi:MAG: pyridoxine 5'-phosphate synthase [Oligoflexia bacterium]|nr:pyridoxine 5'-phosphate synthase [Oligoflexia bacterium]
MKQEKTKLSVNINKIATLRNARGKNVPDLIHFAKIILKSKVCGLTVHPRPDSRHILYKDVFNLSELLKNYPNKDLNIEGYPSDEFIELVKQVQPQQCTLVPDTPEVLTSNAGWNFTENKLLLKHITQELKISQIRVSLFLDPFTMDNKQYRALKSITPDRVELYTETYAENYANQDKSRFLEKYKQCSNQVNQLNIQVNAGHDLNQQNLFELLKAIPHIKEVSIGQALIAEALEEGILTTINNYIKIIDKAFEKS